MEYHITLPSKPRIVAEDAATGTYEIDSLYPGYGHTLGNSLRRIILSSLPGAAITSVKIDGVTHEFSTIEGVKEDVIGILLNLKKVHFDLMGDEPQVITISAKGPKKVTASDIVAGSQVKVINKDQHIADISGKATLEIEARIEKGLGYVPRETLQKEKVDIGTIALDATFTPIRRVNYEVENMRVGDRTDFNRLRIVIETNGAITPKEALERAIEVMIHQLKAVVGFREENEAPAPKTAAAPVEDAAGEAGKRKIEELAISARIQGVLAENGIKTVAGLVRKGADDLLSLDGIGEKAVEEIKAALAELSLSLKQK